jgi:hypothetical protein
MVEELRCVNCNDTFIGATQEQMVERFKSHDCFIESMRTFRLEPDLDNQNVSAPYDWAKEPGPTGMTIGVWPLAAVGFIVCTMLVFTAAIMGGKF